METLELKELLSKSHSTDQSIPGIEVKTYLKLWNRVTFFAREKDGRKRTTFVPCKSGEFLEEQFFFAAGLLELGIEKGDFVAVFSPNSLRCAIQIYSILSIGAVFVPVFQAINRETAEILVNHSETKTIIVGDVPQYQRSQVILNKIKSPLRRIIVNYEMASPPESVLRYEDIVRSGKQSNRVPEVIGRINAITGDDLAVLMYTPGTTGTPKGVMLSHGNFLSQRVVADSIVLSPRDVKLAHLPFSHVFGLSADLFSSALFGSVIAIGSSFQTEDILSDIAEIKPTVLCSVPRMYEKIYSHVMQTVGHYGGFRRRLYLQAIRSGKAYYARKSLGRPVSPLSRYLRMLFIPVYGRIRNMLMMNRLRLVFSGGAPLSLDVACFFGGIGVPIIEGYGLTETSPIININTIEKNRPGTVGPPVVGVEEKLSAEGEILVKGPMVFRGYYKNPDEYRDHFTADGFFKTGDIGAFDASGHLAITGRLKDLIITSGGKNIVPSLLEQKFEDDEFIETICVVGDRRKYLSALVVPNFTFLVNYARMHNIKYDSERDLVQDQEVLEVYKKRIADVCASFSQHEQIRRFTLLPEAFAVESGEFTDTFKFRRHFIQEKYKEIINRMYPESDIR